ncbi:MAG TPA: glycosyltransferase [Patescibacteria group bacterium]|nr:glycosyltransferase [Patescibacteria group bacterium]
MKNIFVIIPSFNEETNIFFVTKTIDQGLTQFFHQYPRYLINADSNSHDNTIKIFKSTTTNSIKISLKCQKGKIGKGYGLLSGFNYGYKNSGEYFLTIDADLKSIKPIWINKLLDPIMHETIDYVAPLYSRNRYEGNATNHFSSPIIYACFGYDIIQPIAGDFALSRRLVEAVINNFSIEYDFLYGVDSIISLTALLENYKIKQQPLDKKIHSPSFGKIIPIFTSEACSTFNLLNKNRKKILTFIKTNKSKNLYSNQIADEKYVSKPNINTIDKLHDFSLAEIKSYRYKDLLGVDFHLLLKEQNFSIDLKLWTDIITEYLFIILTKKITYKEIVTLTKSLLPLYLLRVFSYFQEIDNKTAGEIDIIIKSQKKNIYHYPPKLQH